MPAPLDGVNVLDLSWVMVGPASGRYLADMGADVIKVESSKRIDPVRTLGPFKDGKTGPERSVSYHNLNAGKRCIAIDIRRPEGREIILRLARWADVVLESFTPGVLEKLQLGYSELSSAMSESSWRRPPARTDGSVCEGHQRRGHDGRGDVGRDPSNRMARS